MTHTFFIVVNNFKLRLKPYHRNVLQTCRLSVSNEEISRFWFISPHLPVNANNLPVFENFPDAPRQNSSSQIFTLHTRGLCFMTLYSKKFHERSLFIRRRTQQSIENNHLFSEATRQQ